MHQKKIVKLFLIVMLLIVFITGFIECQNYVRSKVETYINPLIHKGPILFDPMPIAPCRNIKDSVDAEMYPDGVCPINMNDYSPDDDYQIKVIEG